MKYEVVKGLTGYSVKFTCLGCQSALRSPLSDAGKADQCPDCQMSFTVPGVKELESHNRQVEKKREDAERIKAEKDRALLAEKAEREREIAVDAALKRLDEIEAQKAAELERQRKQSLAGLTYDPTAHDWSAGSPYVYHCVQIGTLSKDWQSELTAIINSEAALGWEYYRSESLMVVVPQGCLGALLGMPPDRYQVVVLVFRKPAIAVAKEIRVREELGL